MKFFICLLLLVSVTTSVLAQKKYVDPNERQKRGLMDGDEKSNASVAVSSVDKTNSSKEMSPQEYLCECENLKNMNAQLEVLYSRADEVARRAISKKEVDGRTENVTDTMGHIVAKNSGVDQDYCSNAKIGETNIGNLKKMIASQELVCDVYKLRGIKK